MVGVNLRDRCLAALVALLWGCNFLAIYAGLQHFPPLFFAGLRFAVIALPVMLLVPRPDVPWRWLLGYGVGFGTVQFAFLFLAIDVGMPTGLASLVLQASAPFTVILGVLLLGERLGRRQAVGIGMAIAGMVVIGVHRAQTAALVPLILTLIAALGWAFGNLASRQARAKDPLRLVLWMSVVPPLPMFALSAVVEGPGTGWVSVGTALSGDAWPAVGGLVYIVLLGTLAGSGIWIALMARHPAGVVAPWSLLVPPVGIGAAWLVLDEVPSVTELVAGAVVVLGVLLGTPRPAPVAEPGSVGLPEAHGPVPVTPDPRG